MKKINPHNVFSSITDDPVEAEVMKVVSDLKISIRDICGKDKFEKYESDIEKALVEHSSQLLSIFE